MTGETAENTAWPMENTSAPVDAIGPRVRQLRMANGWSMRELARRAEVSQPFVSKLEGGQLLPSIPTLYTLAEVFRTTPSALLPSLSEPDEDELRIPLIEGEDSHDVRIIAGGDGASLQIYEFRLKPGEGDNGFFEHTGEEVVYVIEGSVYALDADGGERLIETNRSLRIDPQKPHSWRAAEGGARFLLITSDHPVE